GLDARVVGPELKRPALELAPGRHRDFGALPSAGGVKVVEYWCRGSGGNRRQQEGCNNDCHAPEPATFVILRYSEGSHALRARDERSFGVPQDDSAALRGPVERLPHANSSLIGSPPATS